MATLGHIVFAFCVLIPFMVYSRDKFNYKVAFIFLASNQLTAYPYLVIPLHNLIGGLLWAAFLAVFFTYFSRFSLIRSKKGFPLKIVDDGIRAVGWKNAYLLAVAGSLPHYFIDEIFHMEKMLHVMPGIDISYDAILLWGVNGAYHGVNGLLIVGYVIAFGGTLVSIYYFKKGAKATFKFFTIIVGVSLIIIFTLGIETFGGELEVAMIFHLVLFVFVPLFLLAYVARDIETNPRTTADKIRIKRALLLKIVAILSIVASIGCLAFAVITMIYAESVAATFILLIGGGVLEEVIIAVVILGVFLLIISILGTIGSIGLLLKNNSCRYLMIAIYTGLFYFTFPFSAALFLCETDVKNMFKHV